MKFLVCSLIYGNYENNILRLEKYFNHKDVNFLFHYNKRDLIEFEKIEKTEYANQKNVHIFSENEVFWAHYSILETQLFMIKKAKKIFPEYDYILFLDGKSLPCRSWEYIINNIKNTGGNFLNFNLEFFPIKDVSYNKKWFTRQEVYTNIILNINIKKEKIIDFGYIKIIKQNLKNFVLKKRKTNIFKFLFYWYPLYLGFLINPSIYKIRYQNKPEIFMTDDTPIFKQKDYPILNIKGFNLLLSKKKLDIILKYNQEHKVFDYVKTKTVPEEWFFIYIYIKTFPFYKEEKTHNPYLSLYWKGNINFINAHHIKKCLKNKPNLLFIRRFVTSKDIIWFEKIANKINKKLR